MKLTIKIKYLATAVSVTIVLLSCKKWLEAKPDPSLTTPSTFNDLQLLLENYSIMNSSWPSLSEQGADNYYITSTDWQNITTESTRNTYIWQKDPEIQSSNWSGPYQAILYSNTVLENLVKIQIETAADKLAADNIKGSSYFFRGYNFYGLAQVFAKPYESASANQDLGIPLRLTSDFNEVSVRSTVQQTYDQIIRDLKESIFYLPVTPLMKNRPSKPAAYGALAKVYLDMKNYGMARIFADSCLQLSSDLMNYETEITASSTVPFTRFNKEVIFNCNSGAATLLTNARCKIDSTLYNSYNPNDIRKVAYFQANTGSNIGTYLFKGDYDGRGVSPAQGFVFAGITTDEMYLIRAECNARAGNTSLAMQDLNKLMQKRWKAANWVPFTATSSEIALTMILAERRKELLFRGTRWTDLRRFRNDPVYTVTPKRIINGQAYELSPNSPRYVFPIPQNVINLTGMPQNE